MTKFVVLDTETTGLDPYADQPVEVAWLVLGQENEEGIRRLGLSHTKAPDAAAAEINNYYGRSLGAPYNFATARELDELHDILTDATLIGSNPAFDAHMMRKHFAWVGAPVGHHKPRWDTVEPWHHRLVDVSSMAWALYPNAWSRPPGLAQVVKKLRELGHVIPEPDHTAAGDVATTAAVYQGLRSSIARTARTQTAA